MFYYEVEPELFLSISDFSNSQNKKLNLSKLAKLQ